MMVMMTISELSDLGSVSRPDDSHGKRLQRSHVDSLHSLATAVLKGTRTGGV